MNRFMKTALAGAAAAMAMSTVSMTAMAGEHLNFGCYMYAASMDPAAYQNAAWQISRLAVGECLFKFKDDMTVDYCLCDDYTVSEDHKTWTFHIRDGVQFSNGNPCDAQAVADSFNRLYNVCKLDEYSSTPAKYVDAASIEANAEDNTVTMVTNVAYADVTGPLCFPFYVVIDVEGDLNDDSHDYTEEVVATGAYAIDYFDTIGKNAELVKNEYYWGGEVPFDSVSAIFIEDDSQKANAMLSEDIELTENVTSPGDLETLMNDDRFYVSKAPGVRTGFAYINEAGVLGNDALRQAVQMSVDGAYLADSYVNGTYTYGYAVIPSNLSYDYDSLTNPWAYDVDAANALLDDAGIVDTDGDGIREIDGENIVLTYVTYTNRRLSDFAEAVAFVSLPSIGIGCDVQCVDSDTEWMLMQAGEYDLCDSNWQTVATGDPTSFLLNWYGGENGSNLYNGENSEATNYCNYDSDEFDALYDQFKASLDIDERTKLVHDMEQILIDDAAVLVHGYYNSVMISNTEYVQDADIATIDYYHLRPTFKPAE